MFQRHCLTIGPGTRELVAAKAGLRGRDAFVIDSLVIRTLPPARPDDLTELAERITQLRQRVAARTESAATLGEARREQLTRWHHDDTTDHGDRVDAAE